MSIPGPPPTGRFEPLHIARMLAHFWVQGFSGSFRAHGHTSHALTISKEILFEGGRIAWAASDDPQESIKTHLLNRCILRPEQWRLAQEKAGSAHPRQTLLDLGFLSARELQDADRERISGIILSLFNWAEGEYATTPAPLPPGTPNVKIDPRDLVLEGIMSSGDRDRVLREIESLDAVLVVRPDDLVRASLSLPVELVELMGKADGTRSVAQICALSPLSDFMISAAFAALKILGLAAPAERGASAVPPAPPRAASHPTPVRRTRKPDLSQQLPLMADGEPTLDEALQDGSTTAGPPVIPEDHDSRTQPMVATPPGGIPTVTDNREDQEREQEDDSGTRPVAQTPAEGMMAVESSTGSDSAAVEERLDEIDEREGETELSAGIPVPSLSDPDTVEGLGAEEIESVVDLFDGPGGREDDPPEEPELPAEAGDLENQIDPAMEDAPTWIYEPPGGEPPAPRRNRLMTWGGIAAGVLAIGTVLTIMMGGAGEEMGSATPGSTELASVEGPPVVDMPLTPGTGGEPLPEAPQATTPPPVSKSPPVSRATPEPAVGLASPEGGDILDSRPFREARVLIGQGRLSEAARGFQSILREKSGLYTVQLALACRTETVTRALKSTGGAEEFFILPKEFNGRACYRLLWGAFQGRRAAERGQSSVPRAFLRDRNPPFVAPI